MLDGVPGLRSSSAAIMIENEAERRGIAEILRYLSEEELIDLALTVTNRQLRDFEPKGKRFASNRVNHHRF